MRSLSPCHRLGSAERFAIRDPRKSAELTLVGTYLRQRRERERKWRERVRERGREEGKSERFDECAKYRVDFTPFSSVCQRLGKQVRVRPDGRQQVFCVPRAINFLFFSFASSSSSSSSFFFFLSRSMWLRSSKFQLPIS